MPYFETSTGKVFAAVQGEGAPILLLHGFPLSHRMWREQMGPLSASGQVLAPDFPGFGQTMLVDDAMSMDSYAASALSVCEAIAPGQPIHVVGLSMGGYVAMAMLRMAPDRIQSLTLTNTKAEADTGEAAQKRLAMAEKLLVDGSRVAAEAMLPNVMAKSVNEDRPALFDFVRDLMISQSARGLAAAQRAMAARPDSTGTLAGCPVPVLVVAGDDDRITPAPAMERMAAGIPGGRFVLIPGAGHLPVLEKPALVNEAILAHIGLNSK